MPSYSPTNFRKPTHLTQPAPDSPSLNPTTINYFGTWRLLRTSNTFWSDKARVRNIYTPTQDDAFTYHTKPASNNHEKRMQGKNTPVEGSPGEFMWKGNGLMRLFTARWEILGFGEMEGEGGSWMVTWQKETVFTKAAVNIAVRLGEGEGEGGLDEETLGGIEEFISGLGEEWKEMVGRMVDVEQ
ncbi:hypothetical protein M011DRAFT_468103 [Sporormia fimetaria CBS 119925]|uniref:Uncharacterized protein n=1 Tax=Sporormia fimetaria CBS 119925 TaxID=1340428 RepID=A0A6A6V826_9PLEO|nr:hypothetical protein M011DRAFT_468103 [Sporormia fimetaria CBS 119925]